MVLGRGGPVFFDLPVLRSGYFDGAADEKPLLHTWSLSVEEIFYVAFPLALLLAWRRFGDRWFWAIAIAGLLSLGASGFVLLRKPDPAAAFFLPHYRAWELLLGALLALRSPSEMIYARFGNLLTALGLLMVAAAVFLYTDETSFPGFAALLPCVGAALMIAFGQHATSLVHVLLTNRVVVSTGLISYSLYLWHWPVLVFFYHWAGRRPSGLETAVLIGVSCSLAIVSWRFVERPFRGRGGLLSRPMLFAVSAGVMAVMIAVGFHGELSGGWTSRYGAAVSASLAASADRDPRQAQCLSPKPDAAGCLYGAAGAAPSIVLWGDSHAAVFADMLGRVAAQRGEAVKVFTMWSCPPTTGWQIEKQTWRADCARLQDLAMDTILRSTAIHSVVLISRFRQISVIADREAITVAFYATVDRLLHAGKRVVIVYPVPEGSARLSEGPDNLSEGAQAGSLITQRTEDYLNETRDAFDWLDNLGKRENLIRVYPHRLLCDELRCYAYRENKGYYSDRHHLSLSGAALFATLFDSILFANYHAPSQ